MNVYTIPDPGHVGIISTPFIIVVMGVLGVAATLSLFYAFSAAMRKNKPVVFLPLLLTFTCFLSLIIVPIVLSNINTKYYNEKAVSSFKSEHGIDIISGTPIRENSNDLIVYSTPDGTVHTGTLTRSKSFNTLSLVQER